MRFTTKQLNDLYSVNIEKQGSKYSIDNKYFLNLAEVKEYLDCKLNNEKITDITKFDDYSRFKFILINGKKLNHYNYVFLNQIYSLISWNKIQKNHLCLSITLESKTELIIPNLYDNRKGTKMKEYQNKVRLGDKGSARQAITRIEQKIINLDRVISIYAYGIKTDTHNRIIDKFNIVNLYRKDVKQDSKLLAPIEHKLSIAKNNQFIHFKNNVSTIYRHKNIDYQCYLKQDQLFLTINQESIPEPIAQIKILSIPKYEYNYHTSGSIVNDTNKNLTMGKVKKYLNDNDYEKLYSYLINPYLLGYEKRLNDQGNIEQLTLIFSYGKAYFNIKSIQDTLINSYRKNTDINYYIGLYIKNLESLSEKTDLEIMDIEDKLYSVEIKTEKEKIELREKIEKLENEINKIQDEIKLFSGISEKDIYHVINKFLKSVSNKENTQSLNKSNGSEYHDSLKITNINKRLEVKNQNTGKFNKVSIKKIEKLALRFISLLDQNNLVIDNVTYSFNYFRINVNRSDFNNPYKEKINIRKSQLGTRILNDFNKFMLILCMDHFEPNSHKPLIYPSSVENIKQWLKLNNSYLSQYGIEIIELTDTK